ncbi:MAG: Biopolymer transport protein ExbB [Planctomycetota bacterium]|jgi:biopolymer transport protein ExbB
MNATQKKFLMTAFAAVVMLSGLALASDGAPKKSWLELFQTTGPVGYMMVITSMTGTALLIEHFVNVRKEKMAPAQVASDLEAYIQNGEYDAALEMCETEQGYLSNLVGAALRMRHAGFGEMVNSMEQAATQEQFKVTTKVSYLSLIGNIGPLLGLLGTVTGMIASFQVIEGLKAPTPKDLASGVYESLVNTTMGLFIGIVWLTAFFFYKNLVTKIALEINLQAARIIAPFATAEGGGRQH